MLAESPPLVRRLIRFAALPYCYFKLVNWKECPASRYQVIKDLLYIFFVLKCYPDNYSVCRLWEIDRKQWAYYYGSLYDPYQREKLRKEVQRYEYVTLFDDKEVCEHLCRGMKGVNLPKYYGAVNPDMDYRSTIEEIVNGIGDKKIIIKPAVGRAGQGIVLAYKGDDGIKIKDGDKEYDLSEFGLKERSIIQEVIIQHDVITKVSSASVNTIRVVTFYTKSNEAIVLSVNMRYGVGDNFVDNVGAGGIHVGVDFETGMLKKLAYDKRGNRMLRHPTSDIEFEGFQIPKWDDVMKMSLAVQKSCPFYKLLGLDVALTNDGPVLIEANPNPDLVFQEQGSGPLLADERVLVEFGKYDLLINDMQKDILKD